jgi:DNA-directed RNA polymerase
MISKEELINYQKESQKSIEKEIEEKKYISNFVNKIISNLSASIRKNKEKYLLEVTAKIIKEYQDVFLEILNVKLKNIEDRITKPLTLDLIAKIESGNFSYHLDELRNSASKLSKVDKLTYKKLLFVLEQSINKKYGNFEEFLANLKDKNQLAYFFTYPLNSVTIANILLANVLELSSKIYDEEDMSNSWQSLAQNIFLRFSEKVDKYFNEEIQQEVGGVFIDLLIENELLSISDEKKDNSITTVRINNKLKRKFRNYLKDIALKTIYKPMVIEPIDWSDMYHGGFLEFEGMDERYKLSLMKAYTKKEKEKISQIEVPKEILKAINYLQKVGYKIDKRVLKLIEDMLDDFTFEKSRIFYKVLLELKDEIQPKDEKELENYLLSQNKKYFADKFEKKYISNKEKYVKEALKIGKNLFKNLNFNKIKIEYELLKFDISLENIILNIAKEYSKFDSIYFVWNMDFRGRIYPVQTLLHPQGSDLAKALLVFDEEKRVKNIDWFKIHGANLYGIDKETYENRIKWVTENEDKIISVANGSDFWMEADEPFEFYQFCLEYAKYKKDPKNFKTSIPIAIDGSNNGLQHISTLFRDKKTAKRVNVLPTQKVEDVYMDVLEEFMKLVDKEIEEFDKNKGKYICENGKYYQEKKDIKNLIRISTLNKIKEFLDKASDEEIENFHIHIMKLDLKKYEIDFIKEYFKNPTELPNKTIYQLLLKEIDKKFIKLNDKYVKIETKKELVTTPIIKSIKNKINNRSFIKKPVMIDSYGAGERAKAEKIADYISGLVEDSILGLVSKDLAKLVEKAIDIVTSSASIYDRYMQKCAKDILKSDKIIEWKTPLGLLVSQVEYEKKEGKDIQFNNVKISYKIETDKVDKKTSTKGFAPNFIHSLDATHLYMTLNALSEKGITHIRVIHDSFAVYPDDVGMLQDILKEKFIELYKNFDMNKFINEAKERYQVEFSDLEKYLKSLSKKYLVKDYNVVIDDFDLDDIKNSKYMFS